jgi:hypothetical protein
LKIEKQIKDKLEKIAPEIYEVRKLVSQLGKANKTRKLAHKVLNYQHGQAKPLKVESEVTEPPPFNFLAFKLPNGKWKYVRKK